MVQCSLGNIERFEMKTAKAEVVTVSAPPPMVAMPAGWTHMDTIALEVAHELISNYTGLYSAEVAELLADERVNAKRLAEIQAIDLAAEDDRRSMGLDRRIIDRMRLKYTHKIAAATGVPRPRPLPLPIP